jgi:hypothetical protein
VITLLFWNLAKHADVLPHLVCFGRSESIDVFLLAECPHDIRATVDGLNALRRGSYIDGGVAGIKPKVRTLTRLHPPALHYLFSTLGGETAIWSAAAPKLSPPKMLLVTTHLPSKFPGRGDTEQYDYAKEVADEIALREDAEGTRNTVCLGDFNMHPYDPGMISTRAFHALMTAALARAPDRHYRGRSYRRFYNPMWGLFGDRNGGPGGTHFWEPNHADRIYWAMFDQVLLRPGLISALKRLEILESDGVHPLVPENGHPSKSHLSDHLPFIVVLDV